jgi:hypothetical protein
MKWIELSENPAAAELQLIAQLQVEQQRFWLQFQNHPPVNDLERQQAIQALMQRYGQLSVLQGDAMFLDTQGHGRLLFLVNQELNAIIGIRNVYASALQGYEEMQSPEFPTPGAPAAALSGPEDIRAWLAKSSAHQDQIRRRMVGDCIHCGLPMEGNSICPHCGRYTDIAGGQERQQVDREKNASAGGTGHHDVLDLQSGDPSTAESPGAPSQPRHITYDDLLDSAEAELVKPGRLLFNPPNRMQLGQTLRVEVRLTRTLTLDKELLEGLRGPGQAQMEEIRTAPLMAVTLESDGFQIRSYSDEEQSVTQKEITTWEFDIRAVKRGSQQLHMRVSLRVPVQGQPIVRKSIPVRDATIEVQVGAPALLAHFVSSNWQWIIGTTVAIGAVVVAIFFH